MILIRGMVFVEEDGGDEIFFLLKFLVLSYVINLFFRSGLCLVRVEFER